MNTKKLANQMCIIITQSANHFRESAGSKKLQRENEQKFINDLVSSLTESLQIAKEWEASPKKVARAEREINRLLNKIPKNAQIQEEVEEDDEFEEILEDEDEEEPTQKNPIFGYHTDEDYEE